MIPTPVECLGYTEQYQMLANIKDHSIIVARVAETIACAVRKSGAEISVELVVAAALMHDIGKTSCLNNNDNHAAKGSEICLELGLDELAPIVRDHVWLQVEARLPLTESEIVYYSDKRVNHEKVVSLEERFEYITARYGNNDPKRLAAIRLNSRNWHVVEEKIFALVDIDADEIGGIIDADPSTFLAHSGSRSCRRNCPGLSSRTC